MGKIKQRITRKYRKFKTKSCPKCGRFMKKK